MLTIFRYGLRVSEAAAVKIGDADPQQSRLWLRRPKERRRRPSAAYCPAFEARAGYRSPLGGENEPKDPIALFGQANFCNNPGHR